MKKILVINGPNINMLGIREPEIYGDKTYGDLLAYIEMLAKTFKVDIEIFQSNCEGAIIDRIQKAVLTEEGYVDAIIINPAAYTHTSIAIMDALKSLTIPKVEVHLSDIKAREDFRQISYTGMACEKTYYGRGFEGYKMALEYLISLAI